MTLIEALTMNLPIISTDCKTGPREILCPEIDLQKEIQYPLSRRIRGFNSTFSI